jgi:hypothetical protein
MIVMTAVRVEELDQRIIAYDLEIVGHDDPPRATGPRFDDSKPSILRSTTIVFETRSVGRLSHGRGNDSVGGERRLLWQSG